MTAGMRDEQRFRTALALVPILAAVNLLHLGVFVVVTAATAYALFFSLPIMLIVYCLSARWYASVGEDWFGLLPKRVRPNASSRLVRRMSVFIGVVVFLLYIGTLAYVIL